MAFFIVLKSVLIMMGYLICGYILVRSDKAEASHARSMSSLLIYVCGGCIIINAFLNMDFSLKTSLSLLVFFIVTLILQVLFISLIYIIFRKKIELPAYRIMAVGGALGNVGFFGMPIVSALFPDHPIVAGYSSVFVMSMNLIVFTMGVYFITLDRRYISVKPMILNPTTICIAISIPLYIWNIKLPFMLEDTLYVLGRMTVPLCMIVLGMRLASADLRKVFTRDFAYLAALLKLVVFPLFCYVIVRFLGIFDDVFCTCILILSAAPTGAVVLSMAEIHKSEQELSANVVLLSTLLSVITLPIIQLVAYIR